MAWIIVAVAVLVLGAAVAFLFGPTIKAFFGPDFEPASKDEASIQNALVNRLIDGGQ